MIEDQKYMKMALRLARKGVGWVNPNPMVGAVLVKNGMVIGKGYHEYFGGPHAEVNAINSAEEPVDGSTLFVTLEPCSHHGKTPPCAELIVRKGIRRVVVGLIDPNPLIQGKGIQYLTNHGVMVESGLLENEVSKLNEVFIKFIRERKPFVLFKTAMTLDGKIATVSGDSRWISGPESRLFVQGLRQQYAAIMVGIGTVLKDNPRLDARRNRKISRDPLKLIVDSHARIPLDANVLVQQPQLTMIVTTQEASQAKLQQIQHTGAQVLICPAKNNQVDLQYMMLALGAMEIDSVLLEGGSTLGFSAFRDGIIDKVLLFMAPKIAGGRKAPTAVGGEGIQKIRDAITVEHLRVKKISNDFLVEGYVHRDH